MIKKLFMYTPNSVINVKYKRFKKFLPYIFDLNIRQNKIEKFILNYLDLKIENKFFIV